MKYAAKFPEKVRATSGFLTGKLQPRQVEDLLRHSGSARKSTQRSAFHADAEAYELSIAAGAAGTTAGDTPAGDLAIQKRIFG